MFTEYEKSNFYHKIAERIITALKYNEFLEETLEEDKDKWKCILEQQKSLLELWVEMALDRYNKFPYDYSGKELRETIKISKEIDWNNKKQLRGFFNWFNDRIIYY